MRLFLPVVVFFVATSLSAGSAQDDKGAITGVWNVVSMEVAGRKFADGAKTDSLRVVISDDSVTVFSDEKVLSRDTYALDPGKKPTAIDLWAHEKLTLGVYRLDGDTLKMRFCETGPDRPTRVALEPNWPNDVLLVLARSDNQNEIKKFKQLGLEARQKAREPWAKPIGDEVGRPVFKINSDGGGMQPLVCNTEFATTGSPEWSRDGKKIAMDAWRSSLGKNSGDAHIITVNADGGEHRDLGPGAMPSWSPDGTRIAFSQYDAFRGVWIMNADGSGRELVDARGWGIQWSPNGEQLAYWTYADGGNLCVYDRVKKTRRMLLNERYRHVRWGMDWSFDGKSICFKGTLPDGKREIAVVSTEGEKNDPKVLLSGVSQDLIASVSGNFSWAGQGQPILMSMKGEADCCSQVYLLDPDDEKPPTLLPGQDPNRENSSAAWSPDGKEIVFCSKKIKP